MPAPALLPLEALARRCFSFSPAAVAQVLDRLNVKKAPGPDQITVRMLRELPRLGVLWLTWISNAIIKLGVFLAAWKSAKVIMLPKAGKNLTELKSYRPISLLAVLSKVFEKLLHRRLIPFLPANALPDFQFGFRAHHATTVQLQRASSTILNSFKCKEYCAAAFLDIAQAFDRVWHDGLAVKLSRLFPANMCALLYHYLHNRNVFVAYGEHISTTRPIVAGVPQANVLGPLLYALSTADLPHLPNTTVATFVDDTVLFTSSANYGEAVQQIQTAFSAFVSWTQRWKIQISSEKSVNVTFSLRPHPYHPIYLGSAVVPCRAVVKFLGVHFDERLTFATHVKTKRRELDLRFRQIYWLLNRRSHLSLTNERFLYMAVLRPMWVYALPVLNCASNSLRSAIQRFQNKALRAVADAPWYVRNDTLYKDLQIPTVAEVINSL